MHTAQFPALYHRIFPSITVLRPDYYDQLNYMRLAFLSADWQALSPVADRQYSQVQQYAQLAEEYYQQAKANGVTDMEMTRLDSLLDQLKNSGWLD